MDTVIYLIRHADTINEKGIRNTNETSQMINEKEILSIKGEEDSKDLSENKELKNIENERDVQRKQRKKKRSGFGGRTVSI